jgi:hypothetical protein
MVQSWLLLVGKRSEELELVDYESFGCGGDLNHRPLGYAPEGSTLSPVESVASYLRRPALLEAPILPRTPILIG